jgi:two-component system sensor histidine kinase KdpD
MAGRLVSPTSNPLPELLGELLLTFRQKGTAVLRRVGGAWEIEASAGTDIPRDPSFANTTLPLSEELLLAMRGPQLPAEDREVLAGFAAQLAGALEKQRLQAEAVNSDTLLRANELRTALLSAVSHDLRTPLASIKAATSSLLSTDITFTEDERRALLETVDGEADHLAALVENLLDMSRVHTGSLDIATREVSVDEILEAVLANFSNRGEHISVELSPDLPFLRVDPVILERAVVNLVENALLHGGGDTVRVEAGVAAGQVQLRVIDRGPGIPPEERERVLRPFQRLGDSSTHSGVGLGLAVAHGFIEALGGKLVISDTPGGGCTMVVTLPCVEQ